MLDSEPLVSIIVPVYNCERFIRDCFGSLTTQTYSNIEIVAVDDGSTDRSGDILDELASTDSRIRVLHTQNRGLQAAWMAGVLTSRGQCVGFVDADDWVHPAMFQILVEAMIATGARVVHCGLMPATHMDPEGEWGARSWAETRWTSLEGQEAAREVLLGVARGNGRILPSRCLKLFERDLLLSNLHYCAGTIVMGEDVNIAVPCLLDAGVVVCLDCILYYYRRNPESLTNVYVPDFAASNTVLLDSLRRAIHDKGSDLGGAELEYFGWLSLRASLNESRGPGGIWSKTSRVVKLHRVGDDVLDGVRLLRSADLDRTSRLVRHLWTIGIPFAIPAVVRASDCSRPIFRRFRHSRYRGLVKGLANVAF